jgi:hypothetical protein
MTAPGKNSAPAEELNRREFYHITRKSLALLYFCGGLGEHD